MKQIDLEPHQHSTHVEVIKTPKPLFFLLLAAFGTIVTGFAFYLGFGWQAFALFGLGVGVGIGWVTAYPEYFMSRIRG